MRRISAIFLLAVCSLVLCSCGSAQDPNPAEETSFSGVVLQLEDASVVVQPDPDDPLAKETDQVKIDRSALSALKQEHPLQVGDAVAVFYTDPLAAVWRQAPWNERLLASLRSKFLRLAESASKDTPKVILGFSFPHALCYNREHYDTRGDIDAHWKKTSGRKI